MDILKRLNLSGWQAGLCHFFQKLIFDWEPFVHLRKTEYVASMNNQKTLTRALMCINESSIEFFIAKY